jgi:hypothetical protein
MSTAGEVQLSRIYLKCVKCANGGYVADGRLGVDGRYSAGTERLACLAAASWSFDISSERLQELCGLRLADNTVRQIAQKHGIGMNVWQNSAPAACREFREADGQIEFTTDGTCVNTTESWREMKVAIFSKRPKGEAATSDQWATRTLPAVNSRVAFAAIERSDRFGRRWKQWARRLAILDTSNVSVLADGAKWIWEEQQNHLRGATGVLDIFHAVEHIAEVSRDLFGAGTQEASEWLNDGRKILISRGWSGISEWIAQTRGKFRSPRKRKSLDGLHNYLRPHADHLNYAQRLANGLSIGSGQIEGACKNLIGRRLKQTGARWRVKRVNRMAGLCALMYSEQWNSYWKTIAT